MVTQKEMREILINDYNEDAEEVNKMSRDELEATFDMATDTSSMHPNETFDEFMEHEDY